MASNVPMKLLLLAALVAMTAASAGKTSPSGTGPAALAASSFTSQNARVTSTDTGNRKLLSITDKVAQTPLTPAGKGNAKTGQSAVVIASEAGKDRKLMSIALSRNFKPAAQPTNYKTGTLGGDRKLMAVDAKVVSQASTANGVAARVATPSSNSVAPQGATGDRKLMAVDAKGVGQAPTQVPTAARRLP